MRRIFTGPQSAPGKMRRMKLLPCVVLLAACLTARAETLYIFAQQDTWLDQMFQPEEGEEPPQPLAAGGTSQLMVGRVGGNDSSPLRRTLIQFSVEDLPPNALIVNATVTLFCFKVKSEEANEVTLQRITTPWVGGEYNSGGSGHSSGADPGDATWLHSSLPQPWNTPGGDFIGATSATTLVSGTGLYTWTDPALTNDVQSWVGGSAPNHGWIVRGNETAEYSTVKEFASIEYFESDFAPLLTVEYVLVPEPATGLLALLSAVALRGRKRAIPRQMLEKLGK